MNVIGIRVPKRHRCSICRRFRKTSFFAKIEIVAGDRYSIEMPICPECGQHASNAVHLMPGTLIFSDALESSVRTLVRYQSLLSRSPVTKRVAQKR